jgi:hypothetical protein
MMGFKFYGWRAFPRKRLPSGSNSSRSLDDPVFQPVNRKVVQNAAEKFA